MRFLSLRLMPGVCLTCLVGLVMGSVVCSAKTVELGFPDLAHRIKVVLPDDHDPSEKYPAVFYYHGAGGKPDTSLILNHVDGRKWIVVGMTYYQQDKFTYTPAALEKELTLLRSVRRNLAEKRGLDQKRCYVAGFSKGGWISDLLLQTEPSLAGGVILGAGHLYKAKPLRKIRPARLTKAAQGRPVFIGVGRLDGNYPFGLRAVLYHKSFGSRTTFEPWQGIAHSLPRDGSTALQQWFSMRAHPSDELKPVALQEMESELADAEKLDGYERWVRLRQLKEYPYSFLLGKTWKKLLAGKISTLEAKNPVKTERAFLNRHRKLLFQEINESTVLGMAKVNIGYQNLIGKAPDSKQVELAHHDHKRVQQLYLQYKKQDGLAKDRAKNKDPFRPVEPKNPENKRKIPRNPLLR